MVDLCDKESMVEEINNKRTCADCGTTKTPLWRGGPAGPKSLCNACGIRSRKRRRAVLGVNKGDEKKSKKGQNSNSTSSSNSSSSSSSNNNNNNNNNSNDSVLNGNKKNNGSSKLGYPLKERLMALGREVLRMRSSVGRPRKMLCEEEQAAVLLMALSYGSVYA